MRRLGLFFNESTMKKTSGNLKNLERFLAGVGGVGDGAWNLEALSIPWKRILVR